MAFAVFGFILAFIWHHAVVSPRLRPILDPSLLDAIDVIEGGVFAGASALILFLALRKREEALARERDFTAAVLEAAGPLVLVTDSRERIVRFNRSFERTFGRPLDAVRGRSPVDLFLAEEDRPRARAWMAAVAADPAETLPARLERRWVTAAGEQRLISWSVSGLCDARGALEHLVAVGVDVTERREAERAVSESEERLRVLVQGLDAIFWEARLAPPAITFVSEAAEAKLGYPISSWLGGMQFWIDHVHEEDRPRLVADRLVAPGLLQDHEAEYRMVAADGRVLWLRDLVHVVRGPDGGARKAVGLMVDITRQKALDGELEREIALTLGMERLSLQLLGAAAVEDVTHLTLEHAQALTGSRFGFVGHIDPRTRFMHSNTLTRDIWDQCQITEKSVVFETYTGLWGWVLQNRAPLVTNRPADDPRSTGTPPGHVPLERFLAVPALHGDDLLGMIAVANAPRDYEERDLSALERLAALLALGIRRARAEEGLRESRAQMSAMIGSAMDAIVSTDEEGRILVFNGAAETMFGVRAGEAVGQPLRRFVDGGTGRRADGSEFPVECSVSEATVGGGRLRTAILRDVSAARAAAADQARLQAALTQAASEWRATFDALESSVLVLNREGRVLRLNRAAAGALGRTYAHCVDRPISELADREPWRTVLDLIASPEGRGTARQVRDETGGRWWDVTLAADHEGEAPRTIVLARDVTRMVDLQESVRDAERMAAIGTLTAGVAHEVRNPLFAVSANVDALGAVLGDRTDVADLLATVRREVTRMSALMEDLLAYGRPSVSVFSEGTIDAALSDAVRSCSTLAGAAGVSVGSEGRAGSWLVHMDRDRLGRAFENLIENAIQHTPAGATVLVGTLLVEEEGRTWVRCRVRDAGPGFPEDDLPRVFEPFFTRRRGGTGLGLPIAAKIVEEHGGRIRAGNGPDGGGVVTVDLPCLRSLEVIVS